MKKYTSFFLLSLFVSYLFVFFHHLFQIIPAVAAYAFIFQLLFDVFCPIAYMSYFIALKEILLTFHLNKQLDILKQEENTQNQQAHKLMALQKNAREFQTDIFNHLTALRELLLREDIAQASCKLQDLSDHFKNLQIHSICSDSLLNAILQDRKETAEKNHIVVNYQILLPDSLNFPDSVLSTIFFNLLDNGIESCIQSGAKPLFLTLTVQCRANFLHINMENSKNADIIFDKKTTKQNSSLHGYGLIIIEDLVDKYNGSCEWIDKGDTFQSLLMLQTDISHSKDKR